MSLQTEYFSLLVVKYDFTLGSGNHDGHFTFLPDTSISYKDNENNSNCLFDGGEMFQYLGLSKLSLQELQGFSVSFLTVLQGGQLLLHLPLQHNTQQVSDQ